MVTTREIKGSKEEIVDQINRVSGHIVSAILVVDDPASDQFVSPAEFVPPTEEELVRLKKEFEELSVSAPDVDYSREAMYTRMPGE